MRSLAIALVLVGSSLFADEPAPAPDYRELSKLIHKGVVQQLPKEIEKRFGWGDTIPLPPNLPLPRLRTYVKVGDRVEVPHGAWSRVKGKIEEPDKNLVIQVRDFRLAEPNTYRLALDADTVVSCEAEWQQWQKGLRLIGATALADAAVRLSLVCDVGVAFDLSSFPPAVKVDPKVKDLQVDLKALNLRQLGNRIVQVENPQELGQRFEDLVRQAIHQSEPYLKDQANQAIARSLREGKGRLAPDVLLKVPPGPTEKK